MTKHRPSEVYDLGDIYHRNFKVELSDGRHVFDVLEVYRHNWIERVRSAWWVLTDRAVAFILPKAGHLEDILQDNPERAEIRRLQAEVELWKDRCQAAERAHEDEFYSHWGRCG